ncbi:S1C family serine protease [Terracoccus sp. 273MFTsu3.1]|uniref:S1C family serine protease n=1 Tax=Terracoccus sp. 273MFTsu3.1 TaxID=1172188 RepID=UPI000363A249|nr:trypsin-like peptidase domain-containing protein [Terracoccus sp. 273MFTsu3.1]
MTLAPEDHTQQIPQGSYYSQSAPPAPPAPPTPPLGEGSRPAPKRESRIGQTIGVALLAAVLASGGTYAATQLGDQGTAASPTSTTSTTNQNQGSSPTVVQGNATAPDWTAVSAAVTPSVVSIDVTTQQGSGAGSGVVFDKSGHILTNNHVVGDATGNGAITVTLNDGRTYAATIVGTDPSTDLAVIKLTNGPSDLTPITLGDSESLKVGDPAMAVGNPLGLSGTVTTGIVSALNRPVSTGTASESPLGQQQTSGDEVVTNAIQTSAAINPGNSGGALVNAKGELIGINSSIASLGQSSSGSQSGNIGIGFAIPVKEAKSIADQLIKSGKAEHAFLGVSTRDTVVSDGSAKRAGAQVVAVNGGTPAANAGIKNGDVIIAVDGQRIDSATALVAQIREMTAGDKTTLTVIRDGARQDVPVTLAVKPASSN